MKRQRWTQSQNLEIDWVFVSPDELPDGFSQQLQEESQKNRPKFQPALQEKPAVQTPKMSTNTHKDTHKVSSLVTCIDGLRIKGFLMHCGSCLLGHRKGWSCNCQGLDLKVRRAKQWGWRGGGRRWSEEER